jgi:intein/homing endonuclease
MKTIVTTREKEKSHSFGDWKNRVERDQEVIRCLGHLHKEGVSYEENVKIEKSYVSMRKDQLKFFYSFRICNGINRKEGEFNELTL